MFTSSIGNIVTNGNYDKTRVYKNVIAGMTIAEITAIVTKGYYSLESLVSTVKSCLEMQTISKIESLYADNAVNKEAQHNYLQIAKNKMCFLKVIGRIFLCFNSTKANDALKSIRDQAISSSRLYLEDLGIALPE